MAVRPGGSSTGEGFVCIPFRLPSPARSSRPLSEEEVTHAQPADNSAPLKTRFLIPVSRPEKVDQKNFVNIRQFPTNIIS